MNIGIICHSSFGGSVRVATQLALELAQRGHRTHLFSRTTPFSLWDHHDGVVLHRAIPDEANTVHPSLLYTDWPENEVRAFLGNVFEVIAAEGLDVIHFHYAVPFAFFAAAVRQRLGNASPCLIGTLHGSDVSGHGRNPLTGPALARIFKDLDALTTVSNSYSEMAQRVFRLSLAPEVIPNFVPFPRRDPKQTRIKAQQRRETCAPQKRTQRQRPTVAHVSNFRPIKDLQGVIDIFLGIRKSLDAELWLIGDGPEMDRTQSVLHRKAPRNAVRYWGLQHDVTPILLQSDLLLMSSRAESFGLSALEAMACGVPVVAPHVGGLPEVVEHEKTGFLFPVSSSSLAVDFAVALLQDPKAHASMRRAARKRARSFSQQAMVSRYEDLYAKTLRRQRPGFMSRDAASLPRVHEMP